jgi:O-antigen/teichoic acid export membrane protein
LFTSPLDLIPITFSSALFPIISHLSSGKEKKMQGYLLNLVLRYSLLIVLPASVFLIFFSRQVLFYLFPKYLSATSLFPLLIPGAIIFGIANIFIAVIYAAKKPEVTRNIMIFVVILLLILSIPMTQMFSSIGLASAYLISNFFMLALSYFYIKKFIKFTINWFSFLKLFISTVFFFGFLIISDFLPTSLLFKILVITIGFISYLLILFFMKFYIKEDFDTIKAMIRRLPIMRKQIFDFVKFLENHL